MIVEKKADFKIQGKKQEKTSFGILIPYFLKYRKYFVSLFLGLIIASVVQLIFPFLTQAIVDIGIKNENLTFINTILIAQLVLLISKMCAEFIQQRSINDSKTYELINGMQEIKLQGCTHRMRWEWEDVQIDKATMDYYMRLTTFYALREKNQKARQLFKIAGGLFDKRWRAFREKLMTN